jgi:phosphotransferase system HPr (HPr) family protein
MNLFAEQSVEITNALGLHIGPSAIVAKTAISFHSRITIISGANAVDARSAVALVGLGAKVGTRLKICAEGPDAEAAVKAIAAVIRSKFGEQ